MSETLTRSSLHALMADAMKRLFDIDADQLVPAARLSEDLDIDSIDSVNLIIELRRSTGKDIPAERFREVRTIGDVTATLEALLIKNA